MNSTSLALADLWVSRMTLAAGVGLLALVVGWYWRRRRTGRMR